MPKTAQNAVYLTSNDNMPVSHGYKRSFELRFVFSLYLFPRQDDRSNEEIDITDLSHTR